MEYLRLVAVVASALVLKERSLLAELSPVMVELAVFLLAG